MMTHTLEPQICHKVSEDLSQLLADTYVLFLKTQNYHWNITDPRFHSLHVFFEEEYKELLDMIDEAAERIRMLGQKTPGTMKHFLEITQLEEAGHNQSGNDMIKHLALDHRTISKWLLGKIKETQEMGDEGTADLYIKHLRDHDKAAWMLSSHLQKE